MQSPYTPTSAPAQPVRPDANNPYLVSVLRQTLGEKGWTFDRLISSMEWQNKDPAWIAGVAVMAFELGLITTNAKVLTLPVTFKIRDGGSEA